MRIINIIPHPPAYSAYENQPRPQFNWDTPQGNWVGIWGYDWPDQLGTEVRKLDPSIEYQVWQPDLRADKIYEQTLEGGVCHKLFPAASRKARDWTAPGILSESIQHAVERFRGHEATIVHLNYLRDPLCNSILDRALGLRVLLEFHGTISLPAKEIWKPTWKLTRMFTLVRESRLLKKRLRQVHVVVHKNVVNVDALQRVFSGPLRKITMGVDFEFWKRGDKNEARSRLGYPQDAFIFLSVSRLIDLKQIDRFMNVLKSMKCPRKIMYVIVGDGDSSYVRSLQELATNAPENVGFSLPGYIPGSKLLDLFSAADLFVSTSLSEGASVACMEAMACEVPILTTDVGATTELLQANEKGVVVGKRDYKGWAEVVVDILDGRKAVEPVSRIGALNEYHWPNVAARFLSTYAQVQDLAHRGA